MPVKELSPAHSLAAKKRRSGMRVLPTVRQVSVDKGKRRIICNMRPSQAIFAQALILVLLFAVSPTVTFAQGDPSELPNNSYIKSYGRDWNCNHGYQEVSGACPIIEVPGGANPTGIAKEAGSDSVRGDRDIDGTFSSLHPWSTAYFKSFGGQIFSVLGFWWDKRRLRTNRKIQLINSGPAKS